MTTTDEELVFVVSLRYLKAGDRFLAIKREGRKVTRVYGTADMDGHEVSPNYGRVNGNEHYLNTENGYINVKFDHVTYPERIGHPNDTMYERDEWHVYVGLETFDRIRTFSSESRKARSRAKLDQKIAEATRVLEELRLELAKVAGE